MLQYFVKSCPRKHINISNSTHLLFKLIFKASEFPQSPKFDMHQEPLFGTLASSTNWVLKIVPVEARQHLCRTFSFF